MKGTMMIGLQFNADLKSLFLSKALPDQYTIATEYGFIDHEVEAGVEYYDLFSPDRNFMLCCQGDACVVEGERNGEYFILNTDDEDETTRFVLTAEELELVCGKAV